MDFYLLYAGTYAGLFAALIGCVVLLYRAYMRVINRKNKDD